MHHSSSILSVYVSDMIGLDCFDHDLVSRIRKKFQQLYPKNIFDIAEVIAYIFLYDLAVAKIS